MREKFLIPFMYMQHGKYLWLVNDWFLKIGSAERESCHEISKFQDFMLHPNSKRKFYVLEIFERFGPSTKLI